jgi:hypothetical protein
MNSGWMGEGRGLAASGGVPAGSSPAGASGLQNAHFLTPVQGWIMLSVWREGLILSVTPAVLCRAKKGISYLPKKESPIFQAEREKEFP